MYQIEFGKSGLRVPTMAVGCFRFGGMTEREVEEVVDLSLAHGVNFFDNADIYGQGECEAVFGRAMQSRKREDVIIQTKCGIVPGKMYDSSYAHILEAVDGSLKRLKTDYIDVLLLHRPDALMEPEEVAKAFDELKSAGKVRHFGVSNFNPGQIQLLQSCMDMPLCTNQLQMSIAHTPMLQSGFNVNMYNNSATNRDGGVLDFCRLHHITIQPWSPVQYGFFEGCFIDSEKYPELNEAMARIGDKYGVSKTTIAFAWLLRHPAKMQPITGTTKVSRLRECFKAAEFTLTAEEWYELYRKAGNILP